MPAPRVSIVIPTYDRPELLEAAVDSVLAQTFDDLELIVVDDASRDPVEPRLRSAIHDERLTVIRHETNEGANAARNTGIAAASGRVLTFLDDDDRWSARKLERQMTAFEEGPDSLGVVIVGQRYVDDAGITTKAKRPDVDGHGTRALLAGRTAGPFSTMAVTREAIEAAGLPDERFPSLQDREWLIRLSEHCTFHSIPDPLVIRRMGEHAQIGDRFEARRDRTYALMRETHGPTADIHGVRDTFEATLALGVAGSALRAGAYDDARRFAVRALRHRPSLAALGYLLASLGGRRTYRPARRIRHRFGDLAHR